MKIFLDSSDIQDINQAAASGLIDGVTTNPTLMAAAIKNNPQINYNDFIQQIAASIPGPISIEVIANDYEDMIKEGEAIAKLAQNIVLKLPTTFDGLRACSYFSKKATPVNMTLCFSLNQAILIAKAGASYVSPFVGRLDDIGTNGCELIEQIRDAYDNYDFDTEILAASLRHPKHISEMALIGADIITIPAKLLYNMAQHPMTDKGLAQFNADWQNRTN